MTARKPVSSNRSCQPAARPKSDWTRKRTRIAPEATARTPKGPVETAASATSKKKAARIGDLRPRVRVASVPQPSRLMAGDAKGAIRATGRRPRASQRSRFGVPKITASQRNSRSWRRLGFSQTTAVAPRQSARGRASNARSAVLFMIPTRCRARRIEPEPDSRARAGTRESPDPKIGAPCSATTSVRRGHRDRHRDPGRRHRRHRRGACPAPR